VISVDSKKRRLSITVKKYFKKSFSFILVIAAFVVINMFVASNNAVYANAICYNNNSFGNYNYNHYNYNNTSFGNHNYNYGNYNYSNFDFGNYIYYNCDYSHIHDIKINIGYCGDGICNYANNTENASTCPEDCYV